ncbi:Histidine kinase-, DNA gyrase B-, and HSP90-like ATPase [Anaerocolumna jejuensis DSM 15929]|uniref:Stage 0 sporulation protein A homolog n=1 Tax=Anaerocolumna jejuensis DSM 15929 TaxID=1121322 RepID=A0A1M6XIJ1_9FIRM|nr:ATP-binding protein [Anaerocolumna jejuensis]SHL05736.1 Histidine kinase-, DNA gyrase B-, and HSP90-like ATPase [Anaerocolumna jejuensis DSM 15929]
MEIKKKSSIIICIVILAANILGLVLLNNPHYKNLAAASNGVLSLADWDFARKGLAKIGGTWEFYPGKLITPKQGEDVFQEYEQYRRYVKVPDDWRNYGAYKSKPFNSGTFRLLLNLPEDGSYGIKTDGIQSAADIYMNGTKVCESGRVSDEAEGFMPDIRRLAGFAGSSAKRMELVVKVSTYDSYKGGILQGFDFGRSEEILKSRDLDRSVDFFVISCCMVAGICLAGSFLIKKGSKHSFYFGVFLILQGIYISTIGDRLISDLLPMPGNTATFYGFQIQITFISFFCLLLLINSYFKKYSERKIVVILGILLNIVGPVLIWVPFTSVSVMGISFYLYKLTLAAVIAVTLAYILLVIYRASRKKMEYAEYVIIFITAFGCYLISLLLDFLTDINVGKMPTVMMLALILTQIVLMYYRSKTAFQKVDQLSSQLLVYDQLKDRFLAKTSLELQKPANGIISLSEELLKGEKGSISIYQQQNIMQINREGKHIYSILDEMLEASGDNQNIKIVQENIDRDSLEAMIAELEYLAYERKDLKVVRKIPIDFPGIRSDKVKLRQIFYHLIHNAVKFTETGEIEISAAIYGNEAFLSVKDTGIGIPYAQKEIIFIPFYQGKKQGEEEGLGLGLGITKNLIEILGGKIWVVSEAGKGSRFTFSMPLGEKKTEIRHTEKPLYERKAGSEVSEASAEKNLCQDNQEGYTKLEGTREETLLIVMKDDQLIREVRHLNSEEKYNLILCGIYDKALDLAAKEECDLIILDFGMDYAAGYETCLKIRERYSMTELPVIILTETGQAKELQKSVRSGVNDFMQKPFSWEELRIRVETLLLVRKSAREAINQEYKMLHAQIMPHFLYNTLNTIIGLSYKDAEQACEALQYLSTYFRAKLDFDSYNSFVSVEREVELMKAYLAIEKMRFKERLEIIYDLDESLDFELPALTLQPLVENSVQHGVLDNNRRITVEITIKETAENEIIIQIKDNGMGIPKVKQEELLAEKNNRIGFSNVLRKIRLMKNSNLTLESEEGKGTCITINLRNMPFQRKQNRAKNIEQETAKVKL